MQYKQASFSYAADAAEPPDKDVIAISLPLKKGKAFLNGSLSRSEILGGISVFYMVLRAGTFIALLLIPVLYLVISNLLLNPLRLVNQAHKRLQEGDLDYRIQEKANSIEYSYSFLSFNQMADQITTLKIENYEKELDRQKMELKNLQLQIHPHFLLNTFNLVIRWPSVRKQALFRILLFICPSTSAIFSAAAKAWNCFRKNRS